MDLVLFCWIFLSSIIDNTFARFDHEYNCGCIHVKYRNCYPFAISRVPHVIVCSVFRLFMLSLFLLYLEPNITCVSGLSFRFSLTVIETMAVTTAICFNKFDLTILLTPERLYYITWKYLVISIFSIGMARTLVYFDL